MTSEIFLDTSYAIALASHDDLSHAVARSLAVKIKAQNIQLVTTRAVLLEIGNSLSRRRFRQAAVVLLQSLEVDPRIKIIPLTEEVYAVAFDLFRERTDKEWGMVDCISCVVMQQRGLTEVLTNDEHFEQMGFRALLR